MNTVNHMAVGAIIGLNVHPILALPAAFLSHFVLDALPHYGFPGHKGFGEALQHKLLTHTFLVFDIIGLAVLVYLLWYAPFVAILCAIVAVLPDVFWLYRYFGFERRGLVPPGNNNKIIMVHKYIQWCERPWGFIVEIAFASLALYMLGRLV